MFLTLDFLTSIFSIYTSIVLMIIFIISMICGTILGEIYTIDTANAVIYHSLWFELVMLLIILSFIFNIFKYKLLNKKKFSVLLLHLSFIVIFIGGFFSRYMSMHGIMHIRQGFMENTFLSDKKYIKIFISNQHNSIYHQSYYLFTSFHNFYKKNFFLKKKKIFLKSVKYIPFAVSVFRNNIYGKKAVKYTVSYKNNVINDYIFFNKNKLINNNFNISFNSTINKKKPGVKIVHVNKIIYIASDYDGYIIDGGYKYFLHKKKFYPIFRNRIFLINDYILKFSNKIFVGKKYFVSSLNKKHTFDIIRFKIYDSKNNYKYFNIRSGDNFKDVKFIKLKDVNIMFSYGSERFEIPFFIFLNKFKLDCYPGSNNPYSFKSDIYVIDNNYSVKKRCHIYMNNVLNHKGYKFFQTSYDTDNKGTYLTVSHDQVGTSISYLGYFMLIVSIIINLFSKNSRFNYLYNKLIKMRTDYQNNIYKNNFLFFVILFFSIFSISFSVNIENVKNISKNHLNLLDTILIQDDSGRIKPFNTLSLELLRKIYKKNTILGLSPTQWLLSMSIEGWLIHNYNINSNYYFKWFNIPFIKVDDKVGLKLLKLTKCNKLGYTSLNNLLVLNNKSRNIDIIFKKDYLKSFRKPAKCRTNYDKALITLMEKVMIVMNILQGSYLRCFPLPNSSNNLWVGGWVLLDKLNINYFNNYFTNILSQNKNNIYYYNIDKNLSDIIKYQNLYGVKIIPNHYKVYLEILYNKINIFYYLIYLYFILGMCFILFGILYIFTRIKHLNLFSNICKIILFLFFLCHSLGLFVRGYVSCHVPWVNGYESSVFISWMVIFSSLYFIFVSNNYFIPFISSLSSSLILIIANSNLMDPVITNIVPVLNSYWLIIHVTIIICSYGLLISGSLLGLINICLFLIKRLFRKYYIITLYIKELTIINEMFLILGLFFLIIGTFLGGVWANVSWGSYWSWDPKETWALITIIVYSCVLHLRLIYSSYILFNLYSFISILSVIITYFGVNYYLSGLHSYAKGDSLYISWKTVLCILIIIIILCYYTYKVSLKKK